MKALVFRNNLPKIAATKVLETVVPSIVTSPLAPIRLEEIPDAQLRGDRWVVFRTALTGICGSDTKQVLLKGDWDNPLTGLISFPHVLGHETVGIVDRVGKGVMRVAPGDRVVLNPWLSCEPRGIDPVCAACAAGNLALCESFTKGALAPGLHHGNCTTLPGAYASMVAAHESQVFRIPDGVSFEQAVLADPFSVAFHAVLKNPPPEGEATVVVYGAGVIGLAAIAVVRIVNPRARILVIGRYAHQVALSKQLGATDVLRDREPKDIIRGIADRTGAAILAPWHGLPMLNGGVDVIYDTICSPETIEIGVRILRSRGTLSIIGVEAAKRFEWTPIYFKELNIAGSNAFGHETFRGKRQHAMQHYLDLTASGEVDLTPFITHRFPLAKWKEAFAITMAKGSTRAVKIVFEHEAAGA